MLRPPPREDLLTIARYAMVAAQLKRREREGKDTSNVDPYLIATAHTYADVCHACGRTPDQLIELAIRQRCNGLEWSSHPYWDELRTITRWIRSPEVLDRNEDWALRGRRRSGLPKRQPGTAA